MASNRLKDKFFGTSGSGSSCILFNIENDLHHGSMMEDDSHHGSMMEDDSHHGSMMEDDSHHGSMMENVIIG